MIVVPQTTDAREFPAGRAHLPLLGVDAEAEKGHTYRLVAFVGYQPDKQHYVLFDRQPATHGTGLYRCYDNVSHCQVIAAENVPSSFVVTQFIFAKKITKHSTPGTSNSLLALVVAPSCWQTGWCWMPGWRN